MNAKRKRLRRVSAARSSCAAGARRFRRGQTGAHSPAGLTGLSDGDPEQHS